MTDTAALRLLKHLGFVPALGIFCLCLLVEIKLPGVFMDEVNPEYMVVPVVNPSVGNIPVWMMPGNYLFGRFPLLTGIYSGALSFWFALPFYAVFGTDVAGIRLSHGMVGAAVLIAVWYLLTSLRTSRYVAVLATVALAIDPSFLFIFRTQVHVPFAPVVLVLLSAALALRAIQPENAASARRFVLFSGAAAGLAAYGYFIFCFYAAVLFLMLVALRWRQDFLRELGGFWVFGAIIGFSPAILGYVLFILSQGGIGAALQYAADSSAHLQVTRSHQGLAARLAFAFDQMGSVLLNYWNSMIIFGRPLVFHGAALKVVMLGLVPLALFALSELLRRSSSGLRLVAALLVTPISYALIFGDRLAAHHFSPALPLMYCLAALSYDRLPVLLQSVAALFYARLPALLRDIRLSAAQARARWVFIPVGITLATVALINAINMQAAVRELRLTGGIGLTSDAINHFAESARGDRTTVYMLPDWGLFMQFALITEGEVAFAPMYTREEAKRFLCSKRDIVVALIAPEQEKRIATWAAELGASRPEIAVFKQRDGTPVISAARWRASDAAVSQICT